jgi:cyclase
MFGSKYELCTHNATKHTGIDPFAFATEIENLGAGEIVINSVDQDGVMKGFDLELIKKIREVVTIPVTVLGGAGSFDDIGDIIRQHGIIGVAAGSQFVFKGKFRAVLINYPTLIEKRDLLNKYFTH